MSDEIKQALTGFKPVFGNQQHIDLYKQLTEYQTLSGRKKTKQIRERMEILKKQILFTINQNKLL